MKTRTRLLALTPAMALTAATAPNAWALQTEFVETGTISSGYDIAGYFGPANTDLTNDAFSIIFYVDTSKGYDNLGSGFEENFGGFEYHNQSPVSALLTINGVGKNFSGNEAGSAQVFGAANPGSVNGYVLDTDANGQFSGRIAGSISNIDGDSANYPTALGQAFSVSSNSKNSESGYFDFDSGPDGSETEGSLNVVNISSPGVISAAPEPSTWALLLAGVGLSGLALRLGRRRDWALA